MYRTSKWLTLVASLALFLQVSESAFAQNQQQPAANPNAAANGNQTVAPRPYFAPSPFIYTMPTTHIVQPTILQPMQFSNSTIPNLPDYTPSPVFYGRSFHPWWFYNQGNR
jgi:hypothetical protein